MSDKKYLPDISSLKKDGFILDRLQPNSSIEQLFIQETTRIISASYDEIDRSFAKNIARINQLGADPYGYFTLGKEVWVIRDELTSQLIGFEVVTRKRGGSIKIGPTIVLPSQRGKGYASRFIEVLLQEYQQAGARKVYVTAPLHHISTAGLDFKYLGFRLEALLNSHYKEGQPERVAGRLLVSRNTPPRKSTVGIPEDQHTAAIPTIFLGMGHFSREDLIKYVVTTMQNCYDDIDDTFVMSILKASEVTDNFSYERKPKILYTLSAQENLVGVVVCSPKRGGTLKIAPLLLDVPFQTEVVVRSILGRVLEDAKNAQRKKISFLIPVQDWNILTGLISCELILEGILREPYKWGCDVAVLSLFIK